MLGYSCTFDEARQRFAIVSLVVVKHPDLVQSGGRPVFVSRLVIRWA